MRWLSTECETHSQRWLVTNVLRWYATVFSERDYNLGRVTLVRHGIPPKTGTRHIQYPPHWLGPTKEDELKWQIINIRPKGMIKPMGNVWSSPVVIVEKKDGMWRFRIEYRILNEVTEADAYLLPCIDENLDTLSGSQYFSALDLTSWYWQAPLDPGSQERAAFVTHRGL